MFVFMAKPTYPHEQDARDTFGFALPVLIESSTFLSSPLLGEGIEGWGFLGTRMFYFIANHNCLHEQDARDTFGFTLPVLIESSMFRSSPLHRGGDCGVGLFGEFGCFIL